MYSLNKQNISINLPLQHPSLESNSAQWKPSIKVGFKAPVSVDRSLNETKRTIATRHPNFESNLGEPSSRRNQKKHIRPPLHTSEKDLDSKPVHQSTRGMMRETYNKHFNSSSLMLTDNSNTHSRRTAYTSSVNRDTTDRSLSRTNADQSRRTLPSYKDNGIKGILEYKHANTYRDVKITTKCNSVSAKERQISYETVNEFDFRHRPHFLR